MTASRCNYALSAVMFLSSDSSTFDIPRKNRTDSMKLVLKLASSQSVKNPI